MDRLTRAERSRLMAAVRGRDTTPERTVRRLLHLMGYRFRLYRRDLPGTPDIVLPRHRIVVLVNGCFWHAHRCRHGRREPRSNVLFWRRKRQRNQLRDRNTRVALRRLGWRVVVIWECKTKHLDELTHELLCALRGVASGSSR